MPIELVLRIDAIGNLVDANGVIIQNSADTMNLTSFEKTNRVSDPKTVLTLAESGMNAKDLIALKDEGVI